MRHRAVRHPIACAVGPRGPVVALACLLAVLVCVLAVSAVPAGAARASAGPPVPAPSSPLLALLAVQRAAPAAARAGSELPAFGFSVAVEGDTAVVGAVDGHAAYVFVRGGSAWSRQAVLTPADGVTGQFGCAVALAGDTAVVGATTADVGGNAAEGAAYVFVRNGTTWSQQAVLTPSDGRANDFFGRSVAIADDRAVVGAPGADPGGNLSQGAAYVYSRGGGTWSQEAELVATDGAAGDGLGRSVAISGDTAVAGATGAVREGSTSRGAAYVFVRGGGAWSQQAKCVGDGTAAWAHLGTSVAIQGDTLAAGAQDDIVASQDGQGAAYVFVRSGTAWSQQARLTAADGAAYESFGSSIALSGDTAVVGAYADTISGNDSQGSGYVFTRTGAGWDQQAKLTAAPAGAADDLLGWSAAISGDTAVLGAFGDDGNRGSVFVFTRAGTAWNRQARLAADGPLARPAISGLSPASGRRGSTLTINGSGFRADQGTAKVSFGGTVATRYVSWGKTRIRVRVPRLGPGRSKVTVTTAAGTSAARTFTVKR
jgi:hypothetical protein